MSLGFDFDQADSYDDQLRIDYLKKLIVQGSLSQRLAVADIIAPVMVMGSVRPISVSSPVFDPELVFHDAQINPGGETVLADTDELAAGDYYFLTTLGINGTDEKLVELQHRNAANSASRWSVTLIADSRAGHQPLYFALSLQENERLRFELDTAVTGNQTIASSIWAHRIL